jgi:hypothetical protein
MLRRIHVRKTDISTGNSWPRDARLLVKASTELRGSSIDKREEPTISVQAMLRGHCFLNDE